MIEDPNNVTRGHSSRRSAASRVKPAVRRTLSSPVEAVRPHPAAWAYALQMVGDVRRLRAMPDGSVIVFNNPVR